MSELSIHLTYKQTELTNDTWSAGLSVGKLKIRFVNDKNIYASIAATHQFRYIVIPGAVKAPNSVRNGDNAIIKGQATAEVQSVLNNYQA